MSRFAVAAFYMCAVAILFAAAERVRAAATWGVDLGNSSLNITAQTFADSSINGPLAVYADLQTTNTWVFNFMVGADTFDLGAAVNPRGNDTDTSTSPDTITSASAVGVITVNGIGSSTLEINWRANTLNDFIGFEGFMSSASAALTAQLRATIEGVAPGTPVVISYDWDYFATAVPDHEALGEDPESAAGSVGFSDDQGTGPGNLFATLVGEPGPLTEIDDDNDSYDLLTSNPGSYVDIGLNGTSIIRMDNPGSPPLSALQEDLAGSEFIGRLTLTLTTIVPEPPIVALSWIALSIVACFPPRRRG